MVGENYEVGVFAWFQLALLPSLELGVGRAAGVRAYTILERDFFLRLPATRGSVGGKLARSGGLPRRVGQARYAGVKAAEGAYDLDRVVGAEGEACAAFFLSGPGVGALDALGTNARFCPAHVRRLVRGLHGGDDLEFGEAREIVGGDDLRVFDAVAAVARAIGFCDGFEDIEGDTVGAVADGVEVELESGLVALDGQRFQFVGLHDQNAGAFGVVGIRLEHGRGAGAESTVGDHFQSAGFEPRVGGATFSALVLQVVERFGEMQPFGNAHGELAVFF